MRDKVDVISNSAPFLWTIIAPSLLFFSIFFFFTSLCYAGPETSTYQGITAYFYPDLKGRLVFSTTIAERDALFIIDFDDRKIRPVLIDRYNNFSPVISPQGTDIAFLSDRDSNQEIYLTSWPYSEIRRVTTTPVQEGPPLWLPNGNSLLSVITKKDQERSTSKLNVIDTHVGTTKTVGSLLGKVIYPSMNSKGTHLVYSSNKRWPRWDICIFELDSKKERCLDLSGPVVGRPRYARLSDAFVFSSGTNATMSLATVAEGSSEVATLTNSEGGKHYDGEWITNDNYIVFASAKEGRDVYSAFVVKTNTQEIRPLIEGPSSIRSFSWSPVRTMDLELRRLKANEE